VGDLFEGSWIVEGFAVAGPGANNCVNHPPFATLLNGGILQIVKTAGEFGTLQLPGLVVSYPGRFACIAQSPGGFSNADFHFGISLGFQFSAPGNINVFEGQVTLRSSVSPNLIPCNATIFGERQ
jgi:hypothetical protein